MDIRCTYCAGPIEMVEDFAAPGPDPVFEIACEDTTFCGATWDTSGRVKTLARLAEPGTTP